MVFGNAPGVFEMQLPADPDDAFRELLAAVGGGRRVRRVDEYARLVRYNSWNSGFTWGETVTAQVVPAVGGCTVRVTIAGRFGTVAQSHTNKRTADTLFEVLSERLRRAAPSTPTPEPALPPSGPPPGWYEDGSGSRRWWDGTAWTERRLPAES